MRVTKPTAAGDCLLKARLATVRCRSHTAAASAAHVALGITSCSQSALACSQGGVSRFADLEGAPQLRSVLLQPTRRMRKSVLTRHADCVQENMHASMHVMAACAGTQPHTRALVRAPWWETKSHAPSLVEQQMAACATGRVPRVREPSRHSEWAWGTRERGAGHLQLGPDVLLPLGEPLCRAQLLLLCNGFVHKLCVCVCVCVCVLSVGIRGAGVRGWLQCHCQQPLSAGTCKEAYAHSRTLGLACTCVWLVASSYVPQRDREQSPLLSACALQGAPNPHRPARSILATQYVCMYVCMCASMYLCVCVCVCVRARASMWP
jgi:hypothetical protein